MTIVYNELQVLSGLDESIILFAADSRLSTPEGKYSNQQKLFRIEYLRGGIGYFGLPYVFPGTNRQVPLSDWLRAFIRKHSDIHDLKVFAKCLRDDLAKVVPSHILSEHYSGFHLAGYTPEGYPDFLYFSNISDPEYNVIRSEYSEPSSHFLDRDAKEVGWDGVDPGSIQGQGRIYRNGDIFPHAVTWNTLDLIFKQLFQTPNFRAPESIEDYEAYVKTKFGMLFYIYKRHAKQKVVGGKLRVFSFNTLQIH